MKNIIAKILYYIAIISGVIGLILGFCYFENVLIIWLFTFGECIVVLSFAEIIEQSYIHNILLEELISLQKNNKTKSEEPSVKVTQTQSQEISREKLKTVKKMVKPVVLEGDMLECPLCKTIQQGNRKVCWECGAKFKEKDEM